jgi:penicillin-binding protein 2
MDSYSNRRYVILIIFVSVGLIFAIKVGHMQLLNKEKWMREAAVWSEDKITTYPSRGLIFDRNGNLLVENASVYDLMVIPKDVHKIDTTEFCEMIGISKEDFIKKMERATSHPNVSYKPSIFEKQISAKDYGPIVEKLHKFKGFYGNERKLRRYPQQSAGHVLGYIREVDSAEIKRDLKFYRSGDYIGKTGIERYYERVLRGKKGVRHIIIDALGNDKGPYEKGKYDTLAEAGKNISITIDSDLQEYGELLMKNKIGSIVAIEPQTGEILSMVTAPGYNPNLLVGRSFGNNYMELLKDSLNPLFNRALMAPYPPGSIFKMVQILVGLQEGVLTENTGFQCNKALVNCHNHPGPSDIQKAIQFSCNPYFYSATKRIINQRKSRSIFKDTELGLPIWKNHITSFGFGTRLDIDLPSAKAGFIPGVDYYDKIYGKGRWAYSTIYSISIGQGEVSVIPIQMANLAAIIANRGFYYIPHLIKSIDDEGKPEEYRQRNYTSVDRKYYEPVAEAMRKVVEEPGGTARLARTDSITICGKTGTAQNPHGEDHSVFIAFAPKDNPKIAVAVYVENSGFGGTWAAPIASLMIEKYIKGEITHLKKEERILEADFVHINVEK